MVGLSVRQLVGSCPAGCRALHGTSHATSAIDIVLGAFRYCVNERERDIAPRRIFPLVADMMWHRRVGNRVDIHEYGLLLRPKNIESLEYLLEYDQLTQHLSDLLVRGQDEASAAS